MLSYIGTVLEEFKNITKNNFIFEICIKLNIFIYVVFVLTGTIFTQKQK